MLSKTTTFALTDRKKLIVEHEEELSLIQYLKNKMEVVLEQVIAEKTRLQQRFMQVKRQLEEEIEQKNEFIQKLQQKVRQLQGENHQIRYQYEQRLTLMNILKNQNGLLSKEFSRQKEQMKQTIDALIAENRQLKHALIENQYYQQKVRNYCSPSRRGNLGLTQQKFQSYKDLRPFERFKEENWMDACDETENQRLDKSMNGESVNEDKLSKSSIVEILRKKKIQFKQSRVTQIKGRKNNSQFGLQRLQTKTHLPRKRTTGCVFN